MTTMKHARAKSSPLRTDEGPRQELSQHRPADKTTPIGPTERMSGNKGSSTTAEGVSVFDVLAYQRDVLERSILFFDTLRQRANAMLEHEREGLPPLLHFKSELLLDARQFEQPVNYALLRITEVGEECWDDCVDPSKPPVIVIDPRAGHGPGIGGFKRDSEVGIALHVGHPVYFVVFYSEPCRGQTLASVLSALRQFVEHVSKLHPAHAPILYGNCQAGWAATLVSAHCEGLTGPVVLNGSPLSYWAGEPGTNPMRIAAGFVGGAWLTHYLSDLGFGTFDGAWLAQNFEFLKPETAVWDKYANLFTHIDTEQQRFLDFERWWNGFYRLSGEEMVAIVENLFVGNRLEEGKVRIDDYCVADLMRIRNPLVIFASYGDNITPPQQALGWIPAVYKTTDDLKAAQQRIVYLINTHIGHLGIFVSASVARLEHRAILDHLPDIEMLEPGLYEMRIDNPTGDPNCARNQYSVRFEPRRVEDMRFEYPREAFERVREVSEFNEALYRAVISPWVKAVANPWSAQAMQWLHPMRVKTYAFSELFMPWMDPFAVLAAAVAENRHALADDHPLIAQERKLTAQISSFWQIARRLRDASLERAFASTYGANLSTNIRGVEDDRG